MKINYLTNSKLKLIIGFLKEPIKQCSLIKKKENWEIKTGENILSEMFKWGYDCN